MLKGVCLRRFVASLSLLPALGAFSGCAKPPPAQSAAVPSAGPSAAPAPALTPIPVAPPSASAPAPAPSVEESPGFAEVMAALRPASTQEALQALESAALDDREAYARAALAYADTDVPAMTLIWGMTYQAMGGGTSDEALARALAQILAARVTAKLAEDKQIHFNVRLAPGQMPLRVEPGGAARAPLAHVFEGLFSPALTGFRPPWSVEQFYDVLSTWVGAVATHGTVVDDKLELNAWLVAVAKAGHLEAFCFQLLGPAFPAELKVYKRRNWGAVSAYQEYLKASPLRPKEVTLPDELVQIR